MNNELQQMNAVVTEADNMLSESKVSELKLALRNNPEVQNLARSIDERDQIQILEFGKEPAVANFPLFRSNFK